jgi:hypothetical protein
MRTIRLNERDLARIVRRVIREEDENFVDPCQDKIDDLSKMLGGKVLPSSCMAADMERNCINDIIKMVTNVTPDLMSAIKDVMECREENRMSGSERGSGTKSDRHGMKFPGFGGGMY